MRYVHQNGNDVLKQNLWTCNLYCIKRFVYSDIQILNSGDDDDTKRHCSSEIMLSQMYIWREEMV